VDKRDSNALLHSRSKFALTGRGICIFQARVSNPDSILFEEYKYCILTRRKSIRPKTKPRVEHSVPPEDSFRASRTGTVVYSRITGLFGIMRCT
jgi:hypothetical protein